MQKDDTKQDRVMPGAGRPHAWLMLLLLVCQPCAQAAGTLVVASATAGLYDRFIATLTAGLTGADSEARAADITVIHLDEDALSDDDLDAHALVVTIGTHAARTVATLDPDIPVLYTLVPESVYRTLGDSTATCATQSAIFIDQPLARQAALAQSMFPAAVKYGVLLGPTSSQRQPEIDALQKTTDRVLAVSAVKNEAGIARTANSLLYSIDLLLAVNDPLVLNRENAKWLLYTAYQRRLPVIGYSRAYVNAGAAGAVYSGPEQMARQAVEVLHRHAGKADSCLPGAAFPRYFSVAVNRSVCDSLGGSVCDEDALGALLAREESGQ